MVKIIKNIPPDCLLAGGAVRDMLLGKQPADIDYVFCCSEQEFIQRNCNVRKLGVWPAVTYRVHGCEYVPLIGSIEEDLLRRDFTINALLLSANNILHHRPESLDDLKNGVIRPVTEKSLHDDPARIFRAARFTATLPGFTLHPDCIAQAKRVSPKKIAAIAPERIANELLKACMAPVPGNFLRSLYAMSALEYWFAELHQANDIPAGPAHYHKPPISNRTSNMPSSSVLEHTTTIMDKVALLIDARQPAENITQCQNNRQQITQQKGVAQCEEQALHILDTRHSPEINDVCQCNNKKSAQDFDAKQGSETQTFDCKQLAAIRQTAVWMALCQDLGKLRTSKEELPRHYGHEKHGEDAARALAKRLLLSRKFTTAGILASRLHMKAGAYLTLRRGTKVDLLHEANKSNVALPLFFLAAADSENPELVEVMSRGLNAILAVTLPKEWQNRGLESASHLREMRCHVV